MEFKSPRDKIMEFFWHFKIPHKPAMWCNILCKGKTIFHIMAQTNVPCQYWAVICFWRTVSSSRHLHICFFSDTNMERQCRNLWSKVLDWMLGVLLNQKVMSYKVAPTVQSRAFVILRCSISISQLFYNTWKRGLILSDSPFLH